MSAFLDHLEVERHNGPRTRNARLTAIRSLFIYASLRHPEHAGSIGQVLAIPPKRFDKAVVAYLDHDEAAALLAAPDRSTWVGRRDYTLMAVAMQTGLRISELLGLNCGDIVLGTGAHVRCEGKGRKKRSVPLDRCGPILARVARRTRRPTSRAAFTTHSGRRLSVDAVQRRITLHAENAAAQCPSLRGNTSAPTSYATPAPCHYYTQESTPPSSRSGWATLTSGPRTPTCTPTSPSRNAHWRNSPRQQQNRADTGHPIDS